MTLPTVTRLKPLEGIHIVSMALNLPGPAAMMRCQQMGATCTKFEPPAGDPMRHYNPAAYAALHSGIACKTADLKTTDGQAVLHKSLVKADVLLTSFRPSALHKLGLNFEALHQRFPQLCQVAIVGGAGERADEPGHDLTYLAEQGLVTGLDLPATLYADMGGSIMASEAVLSVLMQRAKGGANFGKGVFAEVALGSAAAYLALPRAWGLTLPGAAVGGGHAGYKIYACLDGRVAVAALEPHFAARLCTAAGVQAAGDRPAGNQPAGAQPAGAQPAVAQDMFSSSTHEQLAAFFRHHSCDALIRLAAQHDLPLHPISAP